VDVENADDDDADESLESDTDESSEVSNEVESNDDMDEEEESGDEEDEEEDSDDDDGDEDDHLDEEGEFGWGEDDERFFPNNAGGTVEGEEEALTLPTEADLEEGWTRIDSSGFGGVLLGSRQNNGGSSESNNNRNFSSRARGFVIDAAEAMIGNILRGTDIQLETLAEIEDTLGIRIMHHHRAPGGAGADPDQRPSFLGVALGSGNAANSSMAEGTASRSRVSVGHVPSVNQSNFLDNGLLVGSGSILK